MAGIVVCVVPPGDRRRGLLGGVLYLAPYEVERCLRRVHAKRVQIVLPPEDVNHDETSDFPPPC